MQSLPNTWALFFPFPTGARFRVEGPASGLGRVRENTGSVLDFKLKIPGCPLFGLNSPDTEIEVEAHYFQEGSGNAMMLRVNQLAIDDPDVVIDSEEEHLRRTLRSSVRLGGRRIELALRRTRDGTVTLSVDGRDFRLERVV